MAQTFFITGGTGFIGSHVVNMLIEFGYEVRALKRFGYDTDTLIPNPPLWVEGRLDGDYLESLAGVDTLIHLASHGVSRGTANDWSKCYQHNVIDSIQLYQQAISCGVKHFITVGSCFEYGKSAEKYDFIPEDAPLRPTSAYAASKASFSMASMALAIESKVKMVILRPFHIFGEGESEGRLWPSLREAALAGRDFKMTAGEQVRDFTPVEIVTKQIVYCALKDGFSHDIAIYNLGTGVPQRLLEFAKFWWQRFEAEGRLISGDIPYRPNEVMRYVPRVSNTILDLI